MNNPLQQQLLKAGLVSKQQVKKANQEKSRNRKKQRPDKDQDKINETRIRARQAAQAKTERDRELNHKKQQQAKKKAISLEIDQLIKDHCIQRDDGCELVYNFEHRGKVNRIYVDDDMKQQIMDGRCGIARIQGRYELVPAATAERIRQRNEMRIILFDSPPQEEAIDEAYAEYRIPDDIVW